ncbi:MAG: type II secretion system F family protein [Candidatus Riflebacteria bacterium]|nr:type II secretion system F family protein [Candidatus Riflebacteria bacterium]
MNNKPDPTRPLPISTSSELSAGSASESPSADRARSLLIFCRLLCSANRSGIPLPTALAKAATSLGDGRAEEWAKTLADRLAAGNDLSASVDRLPGMDPVLAGLMKSPDEKALTGALTSYAGHLVMMEKLKEGLKTALFYPVFLFQLAVANLVLINLNLLPVISVWFSGGPKEWPLTLRMLYIADPRTWPISIPMPFFIVTIAIMSAHTLFFLSPFEISRSFFGRLMGMGSFGLHEMRARLHGAIALQLEAGHDLGDAIRRSTEGLNDNFLVRQLEDTVESLKNGHSVEEALGKSLLLREMRHRWPEHASSQAVIAAFRLGRDSSFSIASSYPKRIEYIGSVLAMLLVGFVVCMLCVAFFGPYFALTTGTFTQGVAMR